ncbi:hypothetical protein AY633_08060 [Planococcus maritimus]|nr:hypothetical protein AY633_08060 [Planococcus maritimus]
MHRSELFFYVIEIERKKQKRAEYYALCSSDFGLAKPNCSEKDHVDNFFVKFRLLTIHRQQKLRYP